jgi:hypothetical protein
MHATTHCALSPAFDGEPAPNVLSGRTVVLPCLDEAENLPDAVARASDAADRYALEHEIIVVADGSSDDTGTGPRLTPRTLRELGALRRVQHDAATT